MNGILIVDKEMGKTSFDIIRDVRKKYNIKKVGHIGTLDPMATGVLPVLIGEATKLSDYLIEHDKEYIVELELGIKTDTGDIEGKVIEKRELKKIEIEEIEKILNTFIGESNQIPPMYSAIKVNGKKLYEIARKGKTIERTPRKINIYNIKILGIEKDKNGCAKIIKYKVNCSKGTYIRSLCEDIAEKLGTCGYMKNLRRTKVGKFTLKQKDKFLSIEEILKENCSYELKEGEYKKVVNGVGIKVKLQNGIVKIYNKGNFIGVGEVKNNILKRKIILDENKK